MEIYIIKILFKVIIVESLLINGVIIMDEF